MKRMSPAGAIAVWFCPADRDLMKRKLGKMPARKVRAMLDGLNDAALYRRAMKYKRPRETANIFLEIGGDNHARLKKACDMCGASMSEVLRGIISEI